MSVLAEKRATELLSSGTAIHRVSEILDAEMPVLFRTLASQRTWMDPTFVAMHQSAYRYQIANALDALLAEVEALAAKR